MKYQNKILVGIVLCLCMFNLVSATRYYYQENASEVFYDVAIADGPAYIYFNYTKPTNALSTLWLTKHGNYSSYNSSIPDDCFNNSINNSKLILRFLTRNVGAGTSYSKGECYNGSIWKLVTNNATGAAGGTCGGDSTGLATS